MPTPRQSALCRYHYDAVDRLAGAALDSGQALHRFYRNQRLCTELEGQHNRSLFEHGSQPLAQHANGVALLATDQQGSVLQAGNHRVVHGAFGYAIDAGRVSLLGFNAERPDPVTGYYALGSGYRHFLPNLMRFNSPDSWSPFGKGGLNAYVYCQGDPINRTDPSGHFSLLKFLGLVSRRARPTNVVTRIVADATPPPVRHVRAQPNAYHIDGPERIEPPLPIVLDQTTKGAGIQQLRVTFHWGSPRKIRSLLNQMYEHNVPLNRLMENNPRNYNVRNLDDLKFDVDSDRAWSQFRQTEQFRNKLREAGYTSEMDGVRQVLRPLEHFPTTNAQVRDTPPNRL